MFIPVLSRLDVKFLERGSDGPFLFHNSYSVEQLNFFANILKGMFSPFCQYIKRNVWVLSGLSIT